MNITESLMNFFINILVTLHLRKRTWPIDKDFADFFRKFNVFMKAGANPKEALESTRDTCNTIMSNIAQKILNNIEGGKSLEDAMRQTNAFPKYMCDLVQAGRKNASLVEIIDEIISFLEQKIDIKRKVNSGLFVVKIMGVVLIALIIAAFTVINKFKEILNDTHGELPAFTKAVIGVGDFVTGHWYLGIVIILALIVLYQYVKRTYPEKLNKLKFRLPVYGPIYTNLCFYRMTKIMTLVNQAGTQVADSFEYAALAVDNIAFQNLMLEVQKNMKTRSLGISASLKEANKKYNILDEVFIRAMAAAEISGDILPILKATCDDYKRELMANLETVADKVVTPILFIVFIIVVVIYTAIMLPINSIWSSAQNIGGAQ